MKEIIKEYYSKAKIMPNLLNSKIEKFEKNEDIANEFAYWIENKKYQPDSCVIINGYTAEKLSQLSPYLVGEASFLLLIELRENPKKATSKIAKGFKVK